MVCAACGAQSLMVGFVRALRDKSRLKLYASNEIIPVIPAATATVMIQISFLVPGETPKGIPHGILQHEPAAVRNNSRGLPPCLGETEKLAIANHGALVSFDKLKSPCLTIRVSGGKLQIQ